MNKVTRIIFEYEDGTKEEIIGKPALLFQHRVNSSGILAGIGIDEIIQLDKIEGKE